MHAQGYYSPQKRFVISALENESTSEINCWDFPDIYVIKLTYSVAKGTFNMVFS